MRESRGGASRECDWKELVLHLGRNPAEKGHRKTARVELDDTVSQVQGPFSVSLSTLATQGSLEKMSQEGMSRANSPLSNELWFMSLVSMVE